MPALKIYGRRWHMASDMMPIPALAALLIHTIWIIIFGPIVGAYHVFGDRTCHTPGVQFQAVCGGFLAIYAVSWVFELALFIVGCRGMARCCCQGREATVCPSVQLSLSQGSHTTLGFRHCRYSPGSPEEESSCSITIRYDVSLDSTDCVCRQAYTNLYSSL